MNNFTYNKDNSISMESYFRVCYFIAKYFAISFVAIMLSSCANKSGNSMFQTSENATNAYRCYLSEIRTLDDLTSEQFADVVNEWLTLIAYSTVLPELGCKYSCRAYRNSAGSE